MTELINNGSLITTLTPWKFYTNGTGSFVNTPEGGKVTLITKAATSPNQQIWMDGLALVLGQEYTFKFKVKNSAKTPLVIWAVDHEINVTTTSVLTEYTFKFKATTGQIGVPGRLSFRFPTAPAGAVLVFTGISLSTSSVVEPPIEPPAGYTLLWSDEFSGTAIDTAKWRVFGSNQGGVNSDTLFHSSMVTVSNGLLHLGIAMNPNTGRKYIGGGVDNLNTIAGGLTKGRWEIRAKMPHGFGTDGYFGLYPANAEWPPEIVIGETYGKNPLVSYVMQVYEEVVNSPLYDVTQVTVPGVDWTLDFHVYAFEWDGTELRWYIDGQLKKTAVQKFISTPMKFSAGAWSGICGSNWPDCAPASVLPAYLDIDYVRIYVPNPGNVPVVSYTVQEV